MNSYYKDKKIYISGSNGFIGPHVRRILCDEFGASPDLISTPVWPEIDLRKLDDCLKVTAGQDIVIHLAGIVGGIEYNRTHPGEVFYNNIIMNTQLLEACRQNDVDKTVLVSSACAYPLEAPVPIREEYLFNGVPEVTNSPYGFAKRMIVVQAQGYHQQYGMKIAVPVPFNAFGPGDDFNPKTSHVIPALIKKCFEQKELVVWGTGSPTRNFLYVEDFARGILLTGEKMNTPDPVNIGTDEETSIKELVSLISELTEFSGPVTFDSSKPDGQPRRAADISRARSLLGYQPRFTLKKGLKHTIDWYKKEIL